MAVEEARFETAREEGLLADPEGWIGVVRGSVRREETDAGQGVDVGEVVAVEDKVGGLCGAGVGLRESKLKRSTKGVAVVQVAVRVWSVSVVRGSSVMG